MNNQTKRMYKFYCFPENDLSIPSMLSQKTIAHVSRV
jgi:hypothetical protein